MLPEIDGLFKRVHKLVHIFLDKLFLHALRELLATLSHESVAN